MAVPALIAQQERVADVLVAIETAPIGAIHAAPLVVLASDAQPKPILGLHVGAQHFRLSIEDAQMVAMALRLDPGFPEALVLAAGLDVAIGMVTLLELQARMRAIGGAA